MTKTAFLFAGQGAQYLGMGRDFYDQYPIVKKTIDQASQVLGYDLRHLIDTEEEKLNQTRYTQPAILATSVAIYRLLKEKGYQPDMVAGLSLGEYSALVASGALDFEDAVSLVAKRGVVTPANYNTPAQIVIGGEVAAVDRAVELVQEAGAKRLIPLKVSGPFHTALLEPASQKLAETLAQVSFADFTCPLVGNTEAAGMQEEDIVQLLTRQVKEPVRFYESIAVMQEAGVTNFIEIGPGKVLSGFVKKIDKTAKLANVEDQASLEALLENK
ncbi:MAG: ACP S-malonyltransferase [Streptococcus mitis]|nr:ACP S-malonyltransferase [Streptococcus mitis]